MLSEDAVKRYCESAENATSQTQRWFSLNSGLSSVISFWSEVLQRRAVWSEDDVTSIVESGLNLHLRAELEK